MNARNKCETCLYYNRIINPNNVAENKGNCHRHPPSPFPAQTPQGVAVMTIRTAVESTEWCGEYSSLPITD